MAFVEKMRALIRLFYWSEQHFKPLKRCTWSLFFLGCGAASLGDWYPTFRDSIVISSL